MTLSLDRCTACDRETHDVDGLKRCHDCRHAVEKAAFEVQTVGEKQWFRIHAIIDGANRLLLETQGRGRAEELFAEIDAHGGPECMTCAETMVCVCVHPVVGWECPDCDDEPKTLGRIEQDRDNRDEREGMAQVERDLQGGVGSDREAMAGYMASIQRNFKR